MAVLMKSAELLYITNFDMYKMAYIAPSLQTKSGQSRVYK
jgi:hypothetical protein